MRARVIAGVALIAALAATGFVHAQIEPRTRADQGEAYVPRPATARAAALGFQAVMADYYWLQAIQAVGGNRSVDESLARHLGKLIDVVTTLDPWVDHPYRFAAIWMTDGEDNVRKAIDLLHRGIEHHPDDWRNWFYLGFDHFYFLGEHDEAADALHQASTLPNSPAYLPRLVARLRSVGGDLDVATAFLRQVIESTDDEERRAVYRAALDEIEVEQKARFLDRAREAYRKLSGRDIERVEDLARGPWRMVESLPRPFPDALPRSAAPAAEWIIDEEGRIVSTYYGSRYEVHYAQGPRDMVPHTARADAESATDDEPGDAGERPASEPAAAEAEEETEDV